MQKAVFVKEVGHPMVLEERPIPTPPPGYVLIRVLSTQILPHDTYGRDWGLFISTKLPFILGTNIAGVVEKLGSEVSSFSVGDYIFGLGNPGYPTPDMSGLQEYALLEAESSAKVPSGFGLDDMVTFPVNSTTSFAALFHHLGFGFPPPFSPVNSKIDFDYASQTLVIIGGGSNVGQFGIQFAKMVGIGRIIVVASATNTTALKKLGATHVIDRHLPETSIISEIHAITGPDGAQNVYDCVSWEHSLGLALVSKQTPSTLLTLHRCEAAVETAKEKGLPCEVRFIHNGSKYMQPLVSEFWEHLPRWVEDGKLSVSKYRVVEGLDLKAIEEGLDSYKDGNPVTPVVVHPFGN